MARCVFCNKREQLQEHPWVPGACQACSWAWAEAYGAGIHQTMPFMRSEYAPLFVAVSDLLAAQRLDRPTTRSMFAVLTPSLPWKYRRRKGDPDVEPEPELQP